MMTTLSQGWKLVWERMKGHKALSLLIALLVYLVVDLIDVGLTNGAQSLWVRIGERSGTLMWLLNQIFETALGELFVVAALIALIFRWARQPLGEFQAQIEELERERASLVAEHKRVADAYQLIASNSERMVFEVRAALAPSRRLGELMELRHALEVAPRYSQYALSQHSPTADTFSLALTDIVNFEKTLHASLPPGSSPTDADLEIPCDGEERIANDKHKILYRRLCYHEKDLANRIRAAMRSLENELAAEIEKLAQHYDQT